MARAAETPRRRRRQLDVVQHDVVVQRGVAEQHVEELSGVCADRPADERDAHLEQAAASSRIATTRPTISARTNSSSIAATGISTLCSTAIARARSSIDRRVAADVIDGLQTRLHGRLDRPVGYCDEKLVL